MLTYKVEAMELLPCPRCGATPGQPCRSALLKRDMEHEVHRERLIARNRRR